MLRVQTLLTFQRCSIYLLASVILSNQGEHSSPEPYRISSPLYPECTMGVSPSPLLQLWGQTICTKHVSFLPFFPSCPDWMKWQRDGGRKGSNWVRRKVKGHSCGGLRVCVSLFANMYKYEGISERVHMCVCVQGAWQEHTDAHERAKTEIQVDTTMEQLQMGHKSVWEREREWVRLNVWRLNP